MIPIDPMTALAGLQTAISVVKKASKVANDLSSLAPVIGKFFDAKSVATKALIESKKSGNKSNLGAALQIEVALDQAKRFESELLLLFQATGRADVWQKIKQRQKEMDEDDAHELRMQHDRERKQRELEQEQKEWAVGIVIIVMFIGAIGWAITQVSELCVQGCGR